MAATEDLITKSQQTAPERVLFDLISLYATIWGFVALCLWAEDRALTALDMPQGGVRIVILLASIPAVFLLTVSRYKKDARVRTFVERVRYVVILAAAALLGAYLHAAHKDQSYESHLRDGAFLACTKIEACKASAAQYANTR